MWVGIYKKTNRKKQQSEENKIKIFHNFNSTFINNITELKITIIIIISFLYLNSKMKIIIVV
jgi:hypothetical protein